MTAAWARKQMNHYGDSTSAREKFRSKMEQANTKAYALLDLTNEKSNYQMTREMHLTGLFPCNDTNGMNFTTSYNLIDTWMLCKRWEYEIIQTKREIDSVCQESRACAVLITEEITRVKQIWASATNRFQGHFEDDDEDTENEDDDEDYYEMIDLPIDNDCEIFHSECDE
ncbi:Uncharacterized protein APZ42_004478 [Daphnia magna]|uniref:Uncharacterized protein n=1 Tax=Daphnia magna TaxID=35525 RepID=A0A162C0H8_9CRUS|nr:Uncharacterized protein APZ42_004478 [Daphnia magna]